MNIFKSNDQIVREIHNEFDSAQDRLLQQARNIIQKSQKESKGELLDSLGFTNTEKAKTFRKQREIVVTNKEQAELIEYYKMKYPFQKFLTEAELDRICKKYSLMYAPVSRYKKDVPEKNLLEIRNAKRLDVIDFDNTTSYYKFKNSHSHKLSIFKEVISFLGKDTFSDLEIDDLLKEHRADLAWSYLKSEDFIYQLTSYARDENGKKIFSDYVFTDVTVTKVNKSGLFIAAPKSHFDLKGLKNKGLGFFNVTVFEVKDPIVFRYVKGGVQVITKWGLEANDRSLANPIDN